MKIKKNSYKIKKIIKKYDLFEKYKKNNIKLLTTKIILVTII